MKFDLPFLSKGTSPAKTMQDGINAAQIAIDYQIIKKNLSASDKLSVKMAPGEAAAIRQTQQSLHILSKVYSPFRISIILLSLVAALSLSAIEHSSSAKKPESQLPNVIYILADDLGYGDLGAFGQKHIKTPHLDTLAEEGMRLVQHYSGNTVCAPARASLMTGLHSGHAQIRGNFGLGGFNDDSEYGELPLLPATTTLGTLMREAGYRTAMIGKWGLGGPGSYGTPDKQGFDYYFGYLDHRQAHNHYPTHLWRNGERVPLDNAPLLPHQKLPEGADPKDPASYEQYQRSDYAEERITEDALRYIKENRKHPFFLYLAYTAPHAALQVPEEELKPYSHFEETPHTGDYLPHPKPRAARAGMISHLDRSVGRVMELLKKLDIDSDTLIIFSSDNGPSWEGGADLTFFDSNGQYRGFKRDLYDGGIRMPTIARWPGKIEEGSVSDHVSAFWDVMPTLAELIGIQEPENTDGISFLPTLLGKEQNEHHETLYWEFHKWNGDHARAALILNQPGGMWKAVQVFNESNRSNPQIELYNLDSDPEETDDVSSNHPELVAKALGLMESEHSPSYIDKWNFDYAPSAD